MATDNQAIEALERRFRDSLVAQDAQTAINLLVEPAAVMVSSHGAMTFGHERYRKMADEGPEVFKSSEFSDVRVTFPSDALAIIAYLQARRPRR